MYEQYKFHNLKDILIYTIAKNKKPIKLKEIFSLHSEIKENTIVLCLNKLFTDNLIKKNGREKLSDPELSILLNIKNLDKIKQRLGNYWESGWEVDWKYALKN